MMKSPKDMSLAEMKQYLTSKYITAGEREKYLREVISLNLSMYLDPIYPLINDYAPRGHISS
ncbi:hypothetical protein RLOatenuis_3960 [Rickettsiales bacterium]|nr:hypothetical protein RLOatenuis_3960 [Rickettsiales bacterium]